MTETNATNATAAPFPQTAKTPFRWSSLVGYAAVLGATAFWGTSGIFVNFIMNDAKFSAFSLAFWRDLTTFAVLFAGVRLLKPAWLKVDRRDLRWLLGMGASIGIFHVFWNLGVFLNGAAVATVQQAAMPALVTIAAWFLWKEPFTWRKIIAIVLTFTGTVLVSGLIEMLGQETFSAFGLLAGFGIPIWYAAWSLLGKRASGHYPPVTILTYAFGMGALVLLPIQFFIPLPWPLATGTMLSFAALIALATIGGFSLYTYGLSKLPASIASILAMAEIPIVAVYAYIFLGELMTPIQTVGAILVVMGVLLLFKRRKSNGE